MNTKQNHKTIKNLTIAAFSALSLISATAAISSAAPITYSTGYEVSDGFTAGGAIATSPTNGWRREDGVTVLTALPTVKTDAPAHTGAQSLNVINNSPSNQLDPTSVSYAISPVAGLVGSNVLSTGNWLVHISWWMRVDDTATSANTSDTWAMDVYDSTANVRTMSVARGVEDHGLGLEPRVYSTDVTGQYNAAAIGSAPAGGVWGHYEVDMDYLTRKYTVALNGVPLAFNQDFNFAADNGLDINFTVNGRGVDAAYFDDFNVTVTPEPASMSALILAGVGLCARRRRNAK